MNTLTWRLLTNPADSLLLIAERHGSFAHLRFLREDLVLLSDADLLEQFYAYEAQGLLARDHLYPVKQPVYGNGLFNSEPDLWVKQRKAMQPYFSRQAAASWLACILTETRKLLAQWQARAQEPINLSEGLKVLIQTIMIRILFGHDGGLDKNDPFHSGEPIMTAVYYHIAANTLGLDWAKRLLVCANWRSHKRLRHFHAKIDEWLGQKNDDSGCALVSLWRAAEGGSREKAAMPFDILKDEIVTLFLAAQDTTVNTLTWLLYRAAQDPGLQAGIREEANSMPAEPTPEAVQRCVFIKAAVNEIWRLYPQGLGVLRNSKVPLAFGGHRVPAGANVAANIMAVHYSPRYWEKPTAFYPGHFLKPSAENRHRYAFLPFSAGIHNCIGRHIAGFEIMVIIILMFRVFALEKTNRIAPRSALGLKPDKPLIAKCKFL